MVKRATYPRVSDDKQKEGRSFNAQKEHLKKWNLTPDTIIFREYDKDEGKRASMKEEEIKVTIEGKYLVGKFDLTKRPSFREMLLDAEKGLFDELVFFKWDRFSRNVLFQELALVFLNNHNIKSIPTNDSVEKMTRVIIGAISQDEPEKIARRLDLTLNDKFENGIMIGKMPFGYKWNKKKKIPEIDEDEAEKVREIFKLALQGVSYKDICSRIRVWKKDRKKGTKKLINLPVKSYYNIIKNKAYIGIVEYRGASGKGVHKQIISQETFDALQKKLG